MNIVKYQKKDERMNKQERYARFNNNLFKQSREENKRIESKSKVMHTKSPSQVYINSRLEFGKKAKIVNTGIDSFKKNKAENSYHEPVFNPKPIIFKLQPAPLNQFKKYISNAQNVFYEDSESVKGISNIRKMRNYLSIFFIIITIVYIAIGRIRPFPTQSCPQHAECAVFIHCNKGYILKDYDCIIDPQIMNQAQRIAEATIQQLSYDYGNQKCSSTNVDVAPEKNIFELFKEFKIQTQLLRIQIINFLMNRQNQKTFKYSYKLNLIVPLEKKYSLVCSASLFIDSPSFKYALLAFIMMIFGSVYLLKNYIHQQKIKSIYKFLEQRVKNKKQLRINSVKVDLEGKFGLLNQDLWIKIDEERCKNGQICYYIYQQELYWRQLE